METPPTTTTSFAHQAAKASWASALILILVLAFGRQVASPVIIDLLALLLIGLGFLSGLIALFGIPKHGAKGILGPATVSLLINGLLLFIFFTNFFAARARARSGQNGSPSAAVSTSGNR
ncbi:MAG TPA: hypothetical protein VFC26_08755 [Verrucomicrobiae bacterium]|nr:hypothetical protein [Verrucomicrobiae bacterium]